MKKILYIFSILILSGVILNSCKKDENGNLPNNMQEGVVPYLKTNSSSNVLFNVGSPDAFTLSGQIGILFDVPFQKLQLMVVFDNDFTKQYLLKDNITSVPSDVSVTTADLVAAIPDISSSGDIVEGDNFVFFVNAVLNDGSTISAYLPDGTLAVSSSLVNTMANLKGSAPTVTIPVPCAYDQAFLTGSYHSVSNDWNSEGDITITADPTDQYVVYVSGLEAMEGLNEDNGPLKMIIDPTDYSVSAPRHIIATSLAPWGLSYTNIAYGGTGTVNTCTGTFEMSFEISVDQGSWGLNAFTFTKN